MVNYFKNLYFFFSIRRWWFYLIFLKKPPVTQNDIECKENTMLLSEEDYGNKITLSTGELIEIPLLSEKEIELLKSFIT